MIHIFEDMPSLIERYDELIWTTISKLSNHLDLDNEFMYDIIIQRLPAYLDKGVNPADNDILYPQTILVKAIKRIYGDVEDIILLRRKSPLLIVKYIPLIVGKVQYYRHTNYIKSNDMDDFTQIIQQKLLEKLEADQLSSFKESEGTLFSTFLFKIVSNLVKDIAKSLYKTQKNQTNQEINEEITPSVTDQTNVLFSLIQDEKEAYLLKNFKYQILTHSPNVQNKLEICLKINIRIRLTIQDATLLQLSIHQSKEFVSIFGKDYADFTLGELWKAICPFINVYEKKESSPDNYRKWYVRLRNQLVVKLLISCILKDNPDADQRIILQKINSERTIGKLAEEWLYELVEKYYEKDI